MSLIRHKFNTHKIILTTCLFHLIQASFLFKALLKVYWKMQRFTSVFNKSILTKALTFENWQHLIMAIDSCTVLNCTTTQLYNFENCGDNVVLDCSQPPEEDLQPILREEVEIAVASLKKGKAARVDNIPAELVQAGGETMIDVLTEICNRIWRTGEWPTPWTQSLIITLPKNATCKAEAHLER